jgi:hypothetical protein
LKVAPNDRLGRVGGTKWRLKEKNFQMLTTVPHPHRTKVIGRNDAPDNRVRCFSSMVATLMIGDSSHALPFRSQRLKNAQVGKRNRDSR